mmetsp:Transcript_93386/g.261201  ORF Transcript_93386/g.261201 Transcript_93386/m.261201 type:complete len:423 (+) Transcript_93386:66-1334(+)
MSLRRIGPLIFGNGVLGALAWRAVNPIADAIFDEDEPGSGLAMAEATIPRVPVAGGERAPARRRHERTLAAVATAVLAVLPEVAALAPPKSARSLAAHTSGPRRVVPLDAEHSSVDLSAPLTAVAKASAPEELVSALKTVGPGDGANVFKTWIAPLGREVAVKLRFDSDETTRNELSSLRRFGGGDIVAHLGTKVDGRVVLLIMEAADGNLREVLQGDVKIPEPHKLRILIELLRGLSKLEAAGCVHRDVKPQNVLVFGDCSSEEGCHVKLCDLEFVSSVHALKSPRTAKVSSVGSPLYMAPETWTGRGDMGKIDVWSAGMLAFELFVGGQPAVLLEADSLRHPTIRGHPYRELVPKSFDIRKDARFKDFRSKDPELAHLISSMLRKAVWRRPTVRKALTRARGIAESRGVLVAEQQEVRMP